MKNKNSKRASKIITNKPYIKTRTPVYTPQYNSMTSVGKREGPSYYMTRVSTGTCPGVLANGHNS